MKVLNYIAFVTFLLSAIWWLFVEPTFELALAALCMAGVALIFFINRKKHRSNISYSGKKDLLYNLHGITMLQGKRGETPGGVRYDYLEISVNSQGGLLESQQDPKIQFIKYERFELVDHFQCYYSINSFIELLDSVEDRPIRYIQAFSGEKAVFLYRTTDWEAYNYGLDDESKEGKLFELEIDALRKKRESILTGDVSVNSLIHLHGVTSNQNLARVEMKINNENIIVMNNISAIQAALVVQKFQDWTAKNVASAGWIGRYPLAFEYILKPE